MPYPYIKGVNDTLINEEFISNLKPNAIVINTTKRELQDVKVITKEIENNNFAGFATDIFSNKKEFFFKDMRNKTIDSDIEKLRSLYPKVLITPHIGSYTDEALTNMIEISYENLDEFIKTDDCQKNYNKKRAVANLSLKIMSINK